MLNGGGGGNAAEGGNGGYGGNAGGSNAGLSNSKMKRNVRMRGEEVGKRYMAGMESWMQSQDLMAYKPYDVIQKGKVKGKVRSKGKSDNWIALESEMRTKERKLRITKRVAGKYLEELFQAVVYRLVNNPGSGYGNGATLRIF